jgi:hypothetical protein
MTLSHQEEINLRALKLALEFYREHNVSDTDIELKADKYKKYITRGTMG